MTYSTLLTHLDLECPNDAVLAVSARLADKLHAEVMGVAACQPLPLFYEMPAGEVLELDRTEISREMADVEAQFRSALMGHGRQVSFRTGVNYAELADYIAAQARAADLVITGPAIQYDLVDKTRRTDIGALVMSAGRPVLIVPPRVRTLDMNSAVIAWKDSREARRAVADALPLLEIARNVTVVEIAPEADLQRANDRVTDVVNWLSRHGIGAQALVRKSQKRELDSLYQVLEELRCDLIIAGAYSHSRLREWGFGGITMDLLMSPDRCALLSH